MAMTRSELLPLFSIVVGSRVERRGRRKSAFSTRDLKQMEQIVREEFGFAGFSLCRQMGFWQGSPEESVNIQILTCDHGRVESCADRLREVFEQQSVLLTQQGTGCYLKP